MSIFPWLIGFRVTGVVTTGFKVMGVVTTGLRVMGVVTTGLGVRSGTGFGRIGLGVGLVGRGVRSGVGLGVAELMVLFGLGVRLVGWGVRFGVGLGDGPGVNLGVGLGVRVLGVGLLVRFGFGFDATTGLFLSGLFLPGLSFPGFFPGFFPDLGLAALLEFLTQSHLIFLSGLFLLCSMHVHASSFDLECWQVYDFGLLLLFLFGTGLTLFPVTNAK